MRIAVGRAGLLEGTIGERLRRGHPEWELEHADGDDWADLVRRSEVVLPVTSPVTAAMLEGSPVRFVQQFGAGVDSIDLTACRDRGVPVANVPSTETPNAASVAELAVGMTIDLVRRLDEQRAAAREARSPAPVHTVAGRRVVLVGLGGLGAAIAARLRAFEVRMSGTRAHPEHGGPDGVDDVRGPDGFDDLLAEADVVIVCAAPSGETLFTRERFAAFRHGTILINVARGALVDEDALLAALDDGTVSGAGLDVFADDPPSPDHPLLHHPGVIATPHVAGGTVESLAGTADAVRANLERFLAGDDPRWRTA